MNSSIAGYTGLYRQPYANTRQYGDTIYVVTNDLRQELNMILLTPGCYKDAYRIASQMTFQTINIFVPTMDDYFKSDVFRLVRDLSKIKHSVHFYYPEKVETKPINVFFQRAMEQLTNYTSLTIRDFTVEYRKAVDMETDLYDIYVYDGNQYLIFSLYMDDKKYETIMNGQKSELDGIHIAYNVTFYGGLSAKDCIKKGYPWGIKVTANNFSCREEFIEATNGRMMNIGQRVPLYSL